METSSAFPQAHRQRVVVFVFACLAALVFAGVVYRVENPSIVQHEERQQMPASGGMQGMGDMAGISGLMKKLQENPEDMEAMRSLGMSFMEMRAWDKAMSFWDMILTRAGNDVMALNQKGFCLFELERYAEAAELFEKMLGIESGNHHAHFNLGIIYKYYLSDPDKAAAHFQAVLDASPNDPELMESTRRELAGK
ncbi:MAG: tetratricopeptide repeat protein [Desulfovibrionales bacterium]|nr:tetratricopeptide repeat protein [Desulfovibrionales bacterium]